MDPEINLGWGNNVWTGLRNMYYLEYGHPIRSHDLCCGWFALPEKYSKRDALMRLDPRAPLQCIPGIFTPKNITCPDADRTMVSLIQAMERGKPWIVSDSRVFNTVPLLMM
jgi:hypothetical protein